MSLLIAFLRLRFANRSYGAGATLVVNVTGMGSDFAHGYTARIVIDGVLHTYGEGDNGLQAIPGVGWLGAQSIWQPKNMENIENVPDSKCPCEG